MKRGVVAAGTAYLTVAAGLTLGAGALTAAIESERGLTQEVYEGVDVSVPPLLRQTTGAVDLTFLDDHPELPRRQFTVRWQGFWYVQHDGPVEIYAGGDDRVTVSLDGEIVLRRDLVHGMHTASKRVVLTEGLHALGMHYEQYGGAASLNVQWGLPDRRRRPFDPRTLFPTRPGADEVDATRRQLALSRWAVAAWGAPSWYLAAPWRLVGRPARGAPQWSAWLAPGWRASVTSVGVGPTRIRVSLLANLREEMVGARGFEPPTPRSRTECSTRLSHAPTTGHSISAYAPSAKASTRATASWSVQSGFKGVTEIQPSRTV